MQRQPPVATLAAFADEEAKEANRISPLSQDAAMIITAASYPEPSTSLIPVADHRRPSRAAGETSTPDTSNNRDGNSIRISGAAGLM